MLGALLVGCGPWSWNPFKEEPERPAPAVEVLSIESQSPDPAGERFGQAWQGARLVVDVHSNSGVGRAVLRPRAQGWPPKLALRLHVRALEGFEVRGAQTLRWSLGREPLTEPVLIDLPHGAYTQDSAQIEIQWVDRYR